MTARQPSRLAAPTLATLTRACRPPVRDHLGHQLQGFYASVLAEAQPQRHLDLIAQFDAALSARGDAFASQFRNDLLAALPGLRAFAISLVVDLSRAEDLVQ